MVSMDFITAYAVINAAVLRVAEDLVPLDVLEYDSRTAQIRLEDTSFSIAETRGRLDNIVVVAHNLEQYTNKFYSITLSSGEGVWIDHLIGHTIEEMDLTEFGEYA